MKIAKSNRDEIRENSLTVPMNEDEKKAIKRAADEMGVTMSAFARIAMKEFIKKEGF